MQSQIQWTPGKETEQVVGEHDNIERLWNNTSGRIGKNSIERKEPLGCRNAEKARICINFSDGV
jgi:hypothetical protein